MSIKNWMKIETETTYGEPRVILYNGDVYNSDEKLNPAVQLADMYLNMAMPSKETGKCDVIVLDKLTADFWLNLMNEQKEKAFKQGNKETAEKFYNFVRYSERSQIVYENGKEKSFSLVNREELNNFTKQFGVEIKG